MSFQGKEVEMLCHYQPYSALILALGHTDVSAAGLENLQANLTCTEKALSENKWMFSNQGHLRFSQLIMLCRNRSEGGEKKLTHLAASNKPLLLTKKLLLQETATVNSISSER